MRPPKRPRPPRPAMEPAEAAQAAARALNDARYRYVRTANSALSPGDRKAVDRLLSMAERILSEASRA